MRTAREWRFILMQTAIRPAMGTADEIAWGDYIEKWIKAAQDDAVAEQTPAISPSDDSSSDHAAELWKMHAAVKRAFVVQNTDGRYECTVDPGSQVRIKAAMRAFIDAAREGK